MKKQILFLLFLSIGCTHFHKRTVSKSPRIKLVHGKLFDSICLQKTHFSIDPTWSQELSEKLPGFQKLWDQKGKQLLNETMKIVGYPFSQKNYLATLSVCSFPSMTPPLLINMRYALSSFIDKPLSQGVIIGTIFHELLHLYLGGPNPGEHTYIPNHSKVLTKYKNEHNVVKGHIHLLALQESVYHKLGWAKELAAVKAKDRSLPNGFYRRAWEIVGIEGHKKIVLELQRPGNKSSKEAGAK